jgi:hypothetical protein
MPSSDHFRMELRAQLERAAKRRAANVVVNAGELHRAIGGYPGPSHQMQYCSNVMKEEMKAGDVLLINPDERQAATLTIRYQLPRIRGVDTPQEADASLEEHLMRGGG